MENTNEETVDNENAVEEQPVEGTTEEQPVEGTTEEQSTTNATEEQSATNATEEQAANTTEEQSPVNATEETPATDPAEEKHDENTAEGQPASSEALAQGEEGVETTEHQPEASQPESEPADGTNEASEQKTEGNVDQLANGDETNVVPNSQDDGQQEDETNQPANNIEVADDAGSSRAELAADSATPFPNEGESDSRAGRESSEMEISASVDPRPTPQEEPTVDDMHPPADSKAPEVSEEATDENALSAAIAADARRSSLKKGPSTTDATKSGKGKSIQFADDAEGSKTELAETEPEKIQDSTLVEGTQEQTIPEDQDVEENVDNMHALSLVWGFGMTPTLPVINLTSGDQTKLFYTCSHIGILYDYVRHRQQLLQAHRNPISCAAASLNRRWLVTADKGPNNTIVIWDTNTGMPIRTIIDPHPKDGTAAVAISHDNKFVASLSAGRPQVLAIWDWLDEPISIIVAARLDINHYEQTSLKFKPNDAFQLLSNSDNQVLFYEWNRAKQSISYYAPFVDESMISRSLGKFTKTEFVPGNHEQRALTATTTGNLIVWELVETTIRLPGVTKVAAAPTSLANKRVTKILKVTDRCVDVLTSVNGYVVTGDSSGIIKFLETDLKMKNWFYDMNIGPMKSISFDFEPKFVFDPADVGMTTKQYTRDATIPARAFPVPNFIASSSTGIIGRFNSSTSETKVILKMQDSRVHAIAAHPNKPFLAICGYNGFVQMVDYRKKRVVYSTMLDISPGVAVRCCTFDPIGDLLALGLTNGEVHVLSCASLQPTADPIISSAVAILHIAFSHDCQFLATADQQFTTTLFAHVGMGDPPEEKWVYYGRYRAHYKPIQDLVFGVNIDTGRPRLATLGVDRFLVEYDLDESCEDNLVLLRRDRVEQSAIPMCVAWYPQDLTKENFILTANSQFKFKLYNSSTKKCRYTYLGPTYGSPLQKIMPLPAELGEQSNRHYLAYITRDMLGLSIMPLDGNPHKCVSLLAHPRQIVDFCTSYDGVHIFTCGGPDPVVHMWRVNVLPLDAQAQLAGGDTIEPFYRLLEGGRQGPFVREMEDFFYYLQIKSQGVDDMSSRGVGDTIPLDEVPNLMRALGFYPSEQEIENMIDEVKYSKCVDSPDVSTVDNINLDDFLRLYINHRPAFGLDPDQIMWAFKTLASTGTTSTMDDMDSLSRGELFALIQNKGEHMTEYELGDVLVSLLGYNVEDECGEKVGMDTEVISELIDDSLPEAMTSSLFVGNLLGLSVQTNNVRVEGPKLEAAGTTSVMPRRGLTTEQTLLSEMTIPELHSSGTMTE